MKIMSSLQLTILCSTMLLLINTDLSLSIEVNAGSGHSAHSFGGSHIPYMHNRSKAREKRWSSFDNGVNSISNLANKLYRDSYSGVDPDFTGNVIPDYNFNPAYKSNGSGSGSDENYFRFARSPSSFVRIGKSHFLTHDKRASSFVRIGKNWVLDAPELPGYSTKRGSSFVRIGRPDLSHRDQFKRASSFVRIGKSDDSDIDRLKRVSSFVRIGRSEGKDVDLIKRSSSFVRIGRAEGEDKRGSSFVRIGKSELNSDGEEDKRGSSFVRIGKSERNNHSQQDKRGSSFVRIGKSKLSNDLANGFLQSRSNIVDFGKFPSFDESYSVPSSPVYPFSTLYEKLSDDDNTADEEPIRLVNRGSAFVRIGKNPSSLFLRIGKRRDLSLDPVDYSREVTD